MKYVSSFLILTGLLTCTVTPVFALNTQIENALAGQGDLSMFYRAMWNTGVANELREDKEYTVFAPTNAAFARIQPDVYPCFYNIQCRAEVAAVIRDHIIPKHESIYRLSHKGVGISTLGQRQLNIEETYHGDYTVDGLRVLFQNDSTGLYRIDGVLATVQQIAFFKKAPVPNQNMTLSNETVTTYQTTSPDLVSYQTKFVPGGYPTSSNLVNNINQNSSEQIETTVTTYTKSNQ